MKKYMRPHHACPFYDNGEAKCVRYTGCLFLTPCTAVNEPNLNVVQRKKPKKKRGK